MIRKQLMKLLFTDKTSHVGAVVRWFYIHLPNFNELYFVKEIKQKMKIFGIKFNVTTSLQNFAVPVEIDSLLSTMLDAPVTDKIDLDGYRFLHQQAFTKQLASIMASIDASDTSIDEKTLLLNNATREGERVRTLLGPFSKDEMSMCSFATKSGYVPMYKVVTGTTTTLYFARTLYDRISLIKVDLLALRRGLIVSDISNFYFTRELASKFLGREDHYKANHETEADNND